VVLVNSTIHTQKNLGWDRTDRAWLTRLLRHPARKQSDSILSTTHPAWGNTCSNDTQQDKDKWDLCV